MALETAIAIETNRPFKNRLRLLAPVMLHTFAIAVLFCGLVRLLPESSNLIAATLDHPQTYALQQSTDSKQTGRQLENSIGLAMSVNWTGMTLGDRIHFIANRQRIAVFVDRRVDPGIEIELQRNNITFEQLLWHLADVSSNQERKYGVCRIGDTFYFGPEQTASVLPVFIRMLSNETADKEGLNSGNWRQQRSLQWLDLAVPGDMFKTLCSRHGVTITNAEVLVHDLWKANSLPPLKLEQRLALLLIGFNKIYRRSQDGLQLHIIDLPNVTTGPQVIRVAGEARTIARTLREEYPDCEITGAGGAINFTGPVTTGYEIRRRLAFSRETIGGNSMELQRFSLDTGSVPRPRGEILASIAAQSGLTLTFDPEFRPLLEETMSLTVTEKTIQEILFLALTGSGLNYEIADGKLEIIKE